MSELEIPRTDPTTSENPRQAAARQQSPRSLDHLLSLEIPVSVSFGERELSVRDVAGIGPGSVIELDRGLEAPVDLLVNGRCIARGELVVLDDHYAVRLTDVISAGERILSLGR